MFELDERLENVSTWLGKLELCQVRLMNDNDLPWIMLVPEKYEIREIFELSVKDQQTLMEEISFVSKKLMGTFSPKKINVGALGNMVPQLHIHIICRYENDRCWPGSIWGSSQESDDDSKLHAFKEKITFALSSKMKT